jgi:hypothetical protein
MNQRLGETIITTFEPEGRETTVQETSVLESNHEDGGDAFLRNGSSYTEMHDIPKDGDFHFENNWSLYWRLLKMTAY